MVVIGLTGGIGTGKTTAAAYLEQLGAALWDADLVSRRIVEPGQPGAAAIKQAFGAAYFDGGGNLYREKLADLIFRDSDARARLNALLHPLILADMDSWLTSRRAEGTAVAVLDVPLLFETGIDRKVDAVWVVSCGLDEQLRRVMERGLTHDAALARIEAQMSDRERRRRARRVIETDCSVEDTQRTLRALYEEALDGEL